MRQQLAYSENVNIQRQADTLAVTFKSDVLFDVGSSAVKPGGLDELNRVAQVLRQYPQTNIQIAGHTDSTGSEEMNQRLSEDRARSVKNVLVAQGVDGMRMTTIGFGETRPRITSYNVCYTKLLRSRSVLVSSRSPGGSSSTAQSSPIPTRTPGAAATAWRMRSIKPNFV